MKLLRLKIHSADTCGGLLDGFEIDFRDESSYENFDPLCLIGPNGSGKSQLLQLLAEVFQSLCYAVVPAEERKLANSSLEFEVEYLIRVDGEVATIRALRKKETKTKYAVHIWQIVNGDTIEIPHADAVTLLPKKVVGYTSGENETLSLPFLVTRAGYANEVRSNATKPSLRGKPIPDTRLMLVDYGTNLEVLVANQLLSRADTRKAILAEANVKDIHSCRCVIQLAHSAAPKMKRLEKETGRKGVQLTHELEGYLANLQRCSTCYEIDKEHETYIFDFLVTKETRKAFKEFWLSALDLYDAFHKFAMLNDLVIPRPTRERFQHETNHRRFASRLPEPQDEEKVFRFEQVKFRSARKDASVDYVSLSDGEHQRCQVLGTVAMQADPNVLFLMDEPESHFNPKWRVEFVSSLLELPTPNGSRGGAGTVREQEFLLTTHAPFVPSDMDREKVFVFEKVDNNTATYKHPEIQTYGTTFDSIVEACFGVRPPISRLSYRELQQLLKDGTVEQIEEAMTRIGHSVERAFLSDRLRKLKRGAD